MNCRWRGNLSLAPATNDRRSAGVGRRGRLPGPAAAVTGIRHPGKYSDWHPQRRSPQTRQSTRPHLSQVRAQSPQSWCPAEQVATGWVTLPQLAQRVVQLGQAPP